MVPVRKWICLSLLLSAAFCLRDARAQNRWAYELIPFLTSNGLDGQLAANGVAIDSDVSFRDLLNFRDPGGMVRFTARREPISFYAEAGVASIDAEETIKQMTGEAGVFYWFSDNFSVYGGIRYLNVDAGAEKK